MFAAEEMLSESVKAKVGAAVLDREEGVVVKLTLGGVVSLVHEYEVLLLFPAWSVAWSVTVCGPSARPLSENEPGVVTGTGLPVSIA